MLWVLLMSLTMFDLCAVACACVGCAMLCWCLLYYYILYYYIIYCSAVMYGRYYVNGIYL